MKYYIDQNQNDLNADIIVKDKADNKNIYYIKKDNDSYLFKKYNIIDINNNIVANIKREFSIFLPKFAIYINNTKETSIKRKFTFKSLYKISKLNWKAYKRIKSCNYVISDADEHKLMDLFEKPYWEEINDINNYNKKNEHLIDPMDELLKKPNACYFDDYEADVVFPQNTLLLLCIGVTIGLINNQFVIFLQRFKKIYNFIRKY